MTTGAGAPFASGVAKFARLVHPKCLLPIKPIGIRCNRHEFGIVTFTWLQLLGADGPPSVTVKSTEIGPVWVNGGIKRVPTGALSPAIVFALWAALVAV